MGMWAAVGSGQPVTFVTCLPDPELSDEYHKVVQRFKSWHIPHTCVPPTATALDALFKKLSMPAV